MEQDADIEIEIKVERNAVKKDLKGGVWREEPEWNKQNISEQDSNKKEKRQC
jgi:hypothetical protein